jgi:hypothetical protein
VFLAARGLRNLDAGDEAIEDSAAITLLRRMAKEIHVRALLLALALTLLAVLVRR